MKPFWMFEILNLLTSFSFGVWMESAKAGTYHFALGNLIFVAALSILMRVL